MTSKLFTLDEPFSHPQKHLVVVNSVSWCVEFIECGKLMGVIFEEVNPKNSLEFFSRAKGRELVFYLEKVLKTLRKPASNNSDDVDAVSMIDGEIILIRDYIKFSELPEEAPEQSFAEMLKSKQGTMDERLRQAFLVWA